MSSSPFWIGCVAYMCISPLILLASTFTSVFFPPFIHLAVDASLGSIASINLLVVPTWYTYSASFSGYLRVRAWFVISTPMYSSIFSPLLTCLHVKTPISWNGGRSLMFDFLISVFPLFSLFSVAMRFVVIVFCCSWVSLVNGVFGVQSWLGYGSGVVCLCGYSRFFLFAVILGEGGGSMAGASRGPFTRSYMAPTVILAQSTMRLGFALRETSSSLRMV